MTEKKIKYISDEIKPFYNIIEYDYNIESELTRPKCNTFNVNDITYTCEKKKQLLDTSNYITNPSLVNTGYNDLENYSLIKFGESTRLNNNTLRDNDNDRIYLTLYNNNTNKIFSFPEDTRHLNKKYFI
jgi:hypothetical protein